MLVSNVKDRIRKELTNFKKAKTEKERSITAWKLFLFCLKIERKDILIKEGPDKSLQQAINIIIDEFSEYDLYYGDIKNHKGMLFTDKKLSKFRRSPKTLAKRIKKILLNL